MINLISDDGCDCSISWHYYLNAAEQHRKLLEVGSFKHYHDRVVKDDTGSKELVNLRNRKTFIKDFINGPDKCIYVSLVLSLA